MNLPFKFALRYIFSKKSTNAINIISGISVLGICIGSMALIVIMSVFNGFEGLLGDMIGSFKSDVKVSIIEGKVFVIDSNKIEAIQALKGVEHVSKTLEEIALIEYDGIQNIGKIKGVDEQFRRVNALDTCLSSGQYKTYDAQKNVHYALIGAALEYTLNVSLNGSVKQHLTIYMPKRNKKTLSMNPNRKPFKKRKVYPAGIYAIQQPEHDNYVITNLAFVQELTSYKNGEISALEIKLNPQASNRTIAKIEAILGRQYLVQNRYQQDEALYKITILEKYVAVLIFAFTLFLVAFNMVGALWMLVLEKKKDIASLKSMGATNQLIKQIFVAEGFMLSAFGLILGCILAFLLIYLQQEYSLVQLSGSGDFIIDAYPVELRFSDLIQVVLIVLGIGTAAAWIPASRASKVSSVLRKD
jgi:lipoprotein-releasing system permease protein